MLDGNHVNFNISVSTVLLAPAMLTTLALCWPALLTGAVLGALAAPERCEETGWRGLELRGRRVRPVLSESR